MSYARDVRSKCNSCRPSCGIHFCCPNLTETGTRVHILAKLTNNKLHASAVCALLHAVRRAELIGAYLQLFLSNVENIKGNKLRESLRDKGNVIELNFLVQTRIILLLR